MNQTQDLVFDITGMDCADCAMTVERVASATPGVDRAAVNFAVGTLTVTPAASANGELRRSVAHNVDRAGYSAVLREDGRRTLAPLVAWYRNPAVIHASIALALWVLAAAVNRLTDANLVSVGLYLAAIVLGGYPIGRAAWQAAKVRRIDMNVLMTISVIGAAMIGEWSEGGLVVVLFSIGTALQAITLDRTRSSIRTLFELTPEEATLLRDNAELRVAATSLSIDDVVRIRPGERLPADGEILAGTSTFNESAITGESMPVEKGPGSAVFAGSLNGGGLVDVRVSTEPENSTIASIIHLVEEAQSTKAPSQQLVDRFAAVYTPIVVVMAIALAVFGGVFGDAQTWFYRALVLLVIACPCALVISTPVSIVSAIGNATRLGMLVKGGAALEEAGRITTVAFDKTGTLTLGKPMVTAVQTTGELSDDELVTIAAAIERGSEHPLAHAVVAQQVRRQLPELEVTGFEAITSAGAIGEIGGKRFGVGNARLLSMLGVDVPDDANTAATPIYVAEEGALLGTILVADQTRSGARGVLERLRSAGIEKIAMLTGDRAIVANTIAEDLRIDQVCAELLPQDKSDTVRAWQQAGERIMLIGDGVNDAPALAHANVGVAMGLAGTDIALDSADMALMRDDLAVIPQVVALSRRTVQIIRQNITLSLVTKLIALVLGVFGFVSLWLAVIVDVGTSVLVTLNGMRLARNRRT